MKEYTNEDILVLLTSIRAKTELDMRIATIGRNSMEVQKLLVVQSYIDDLIDSTQDDIIDERLENEIEDITELAPWEDEDWEGYGF
jgi:hypothetical protein